MIRAVSYLRLSKDDGKKIKESDSIENQRRIISIYLEKHPEIILVNEYVDDGYTGLNFDRPGYKMMVKDMTVNEIQLVLIKDFSRLGRKLNLVLNEIERITDKKINADIFSITESMSAKNDSGDIKFSLEIMLNEHYSQNISKKILSEVNAKHQLGLFIGSHTSYGYKRDRKDKHHLVIDEYPAKVVRRIFDAYISGKSKLSIAKSLNKEKILCPSAYKEVVGENYRNSNRLPATFQWTYSTINKVLHNQIYAGDMVQGKATYSKFKKGNRSFKKEDWVIVENTHEAIIDKDIFFKVQELLERKNRSIDFTNVSLFAGFVKCNECGRALVKTDTKSGRNYICSTYKSLGKDQCSRHEVSEEFLKLTVLNYINASIKENYKAIITLLKAAEKRLTEQRESRNATDNLQNMILKCESYQAKLLEKNADGIISDSEYKKSYTLYQQKIFEVNELINKSNSSDNPSLIAIFNNDHIVEGLRQGYFSELSRELLSTFVDSIIVSNQEPQQIITVNWSFYNSP